jgi:hypothetical protein
MSSGKKPKRSSASICPTEEKFSLRQATDSGLKVVGRKSRTALDSPLFVKRICKQCESTFVILAAKLLEPQLGQFCTRSCATRHWQGRKPEGWFADHAKKSLVPWQQRNGAWNKGKAWSDEHVKGMSERSKARGDVFQGHRGGNGAGMTIEEEALSKVLEPGWHYNLPIKTRELLAAGWEKLPPCYKPDFAWPEKKLCLEVDGHTHRTKMGKRRDFKKTCALEALGWTVLRISNSEVQKMCGISK